MSNNPVQIVLNSSNYIKRAEVLPGGGNKDFYANRDDEFVVHKARLAGAVGGLFDDGFRGGELAYAHIELQESAWAKSHRPVGAVFPANRVRTISGSDLGSLVVELARDDVQQIINKILSAEDHTNWVIDEASGKKVAKPKRVRSEVGAIKSIRAYTEADRRQFTVEQAYSWLKDPRTGGAYIVESFIPVNAANVVTNSQKLDMADGLFRGFVEGLDDLGLDIMVAEVRPDWAKNKMVVVQLKGDGSITLDGHRRLIGYMGSNAAVKSILLPPILQSQKTNTGDADVGAMPEADESVSYPVVGIIDTGVADIAPLKTWRAGAVDFVDPARQDYSHGTFIAGLVSLSGALNSGIGFNEVGCRFYDLGIFPTSNFGDYYPKGFLDFLEQLDAEIGAAVGAGVRVFNMSLAVTTPVDDGSYSLFASIMDSIADKYDVVFVLPSGNLDAAAFRASWPDNPDDCLRMLAEYRSQGKDKIFQPADSVRSITVGAFDPACPKGELRPARYTRRGPGPSLGAKPDVAHIGGSADGGHGLFSLTPLSKVVGNCGTSFAAPMVAKSLAALDHFIEGGISREALMALLMHNSELPACLSHKKLERIAADFVGAGLPEDSMAALSLDDSEITLVFSGVLLPGHELVFDFAWPASLVMDGKCSGSVKVTTVYRPPINRNCGAEFILVNIDTWLRQEKIDLETGESTFHNQLKGSADKSIEKERIAHGAKWWPSKRVEAKFRGKGNSSQWKLVLEALARSGYELPSEGVPFATILSISDPKGGGRVFDETRQQLQAIGVELSDIRTALRGRLRHGSRS